MASARISVLRLFISIILPRNIKPVTHQASAWRHFILLSTKYIPPQLTGILAFKWHHLLISVNFQYRTDSWFSYPLSTKNWTWLLVKPRITWSVPVKILTGNYVVVIVTCKNVDSCGAFMGGFLYTLVESAPVADITCKINRCKQSYFFCIIFHVPGVWMYIYNSCFSINLTRLPGYRLIKPVLWALCSPTY